MAASEEGHSASDTVEKCSIDGQSEGCDRNPFVAACAVSNGYDIWVGSQFLKDKTPNANAIAAQVGGVQPYFDLFLH